jgi:plasmid maintenance system killer protein
MISTFKSAGTEDIFDGVASQAARKCCPQSIWPVACRKLEINRVREINELNVPPGNRLERLKPIPPARFVFGRSAWERILNSREYIPKTSGGQPPLLTYCY